MTRGKKSVVLQQSSLSYENVFPSAITILVTGWIQSADQNIISAAGVSVRGKGMLTVGDTGGLILVSG